MARDTGNHERSDSDGSQLTYLQQQFKTEVCNLLLPNHAKGTAFLRFLAHYIHKWHIKSVDPFDVLLEGILRGLRVIEQTGKSIEKPEAWLRGTCLNILKDKVKYSKKNEQLVHDLAVWHSAHSSRSEDPLVQSELLEQLETLQEAYQQLPILDREIIHLRFFSGKTYKQIQRTYELLNGQLIQEATLRKREARALKRLEKIFLKLYQSNKDPAL